MECNDEKIRAEDEIAIDLYPFFSQKFPLEFCVLRNRKAPTRMRQAAIEHIRRSHPQVAELLALRHQVFEVP